jgi:hypothetical protein
MPWRSRFVPAFPTDQPCRDLDALVPDEGVASARLAGAPCYPQSQ